MSGNMRLVHGGRMEDCLHAAQTMPNARAVGYRADVSRKRRVNDVEADDLVFQVLQGAGQGFAQMPSASCNQSFHTRVASRLSLWASSRYSTRPFPGAPRANRSRLMLNTCENHVLLI